RRRGLAGFDGPIQLGDEAVEVALDEVPPVRPRGERAVVAALGAEGDVDVDAEAERHRSSLTDLRRFDTSGQALPGWTARPRARCRGARRWPSCRRFGW